VTTRQARYYFIEGKAKPHRITFWEGDIRKTTHFEKKVDALEFQSDKNLHAVNSALSVSTEERLLIANLRKVAELHSIDLLDASQRFMQFMKDGALPQVQTEMAFHEFMAFCEQKNLRPKTKEQHELYCRKFMLTRKERMITSITRDEVLAFILGFYKNDQSRDKVKVSLLSWLRWCERKGWAAGWKDNLKWDRSIKDEKCVSVMSPDDFSKILPEIPVSCRIGVALMGFAGIRPEELISDTGKQILRWQNVRLEEGIIEIPGAVSKVRKRRVLHNIPENLRKWLDTAPEKSRLGPIVTCSYRNYRKNRKAACERLKMPDVWSQDILRHSFGSYAYHQLGVELAIEYMGHTNPKMFFRHYKGAVSDDAAKKWFSIIPINSV